MMRIRMTDVDEKRVLDCIVQHSDGVTTIRMTLEDWA